MVAVVLAADADTDEIVGGVLSTVVLFTVTVIGELVFGFPDELKS